MRLDLGDGEIVEVERVFQAIRLSVTAYQDDEGQDKTTYVYMTTEQAKTLITAIEETIKKANLFVCP